MNDRNSKSDHRAGKGQIKHQRIIDDHVRRSTADCSCMLRVEPLKLQLCTADGAQIMVAGNVKLTTKIVDIYTPCRWQGGAVGCMILRMPTYRHTLYQIKLLLGGKNKSYDAKVEK